MKTKKVIHGGWRGALAKKIMGRKFQFGYISH